MSTGAASEAPAQAPAKPAPAAPQVGESTSIGFVAAAFGIVSVMYLVALFGLR